MISLSRRHLFTGAAGLVATTALPRITLAQAPAPAPAAPAPAAAEGPFKLPPLPYATNALEPHIDARTMEIHHDKHHGAYVANMNNFAKTAPQLGQTPVETILANLVNLPDGIRVGVRNNLGGHANHTMFWEIMGPNGGQPEGEVLAAIDRDLGGLEKMKAAFNTAGAGQFAADVWQARPARQRRVGARLLSELPEPPRRLSQGVVERGELAEDRRALRRRQSRHADALNAACEKHKGRPRGRPFALVACRVLPDVSLATATTGRLPPAAKPCHSNDNICLSIPATNLIRPYQNWLPYSGKAADMRFSREDLQWL